MSRGARLWLGLRLLLGLVFVLFSANPVRMPSGVSAAIIVAVCVLSYIDLRIRQEDSLLHNLGMPAMLIVAISMVPAILAESAIKIAQSLNR